MSKDTIVEIRTPTRNIVFSPATDVRLQDGERPELLHLRPSRKIRICPFLSELGSSWGKRLQFRLNGSFRS
jgi:hypothetical protein